MAEQNKTWLDKIMARPFAFPSESAPGSPVVISSSKSEILSSPIRLRVASLYLGTKVVATLKTLTNPLNSLSFISSTKAAYSSGWLSSHSLISLLKLSYSCCPI